MIVVSAATVSLSICPSVCLYACGLFVCLVKRLLVFAVICYRALVVGVSAVSSVSVGDYLCKIAKQFRSRQKMCVCVCYMVYELGQMGGASLVIKWIHIKVEWRCQIHQLRKKCL